MDKLRFFAVDWNEFPTCRLFCILKVLRQIYLFDRIIATSCFSANSCFTIIFKEMIKYSHFRSLKIKTYLNIALEGRLFKSVEVLGKSVLLRNGTQEASLFSDIEDISKIAGINTACKRVITWLTFWLEFFIAELSWIYINHKRWITEYLTTPSRL